MRIAIEMDIDTDLSCEAIKEMVEQTLFMLPVDEEVIVNQSNVTVRLVGPKITGK